MQLESYILYWTKTVQITAPGIKLRLTNCACVFDQSYRSLSGWSCKDLKLWFSALYPGVSFYINWPSDFSYVLYLKQKHQGQGWKSSIYIYDIVLILPSNSNTDAFTSSGSVLTGKIQIFLTAVTRAFILGKKVILGFVKITQYIYFLLLYLK